MGRGGRGKGRKFNNAGRGGGRIGRPGGDRSGALREDRKEIAKDNRNYEEYYNELISGDHDEAVRAEFWAALRRELPNSFRFTGSRAHALAVQHRLQTHYVPEITAIKYDGEYVDPPTPVPWYPDQLAWSMTTPKGVIRRFPPFASFQKFLVSETEVGNISRQEIVSMIPPLLMELEPYMTVLDMCAAPGSKTVQLMEALHAGEEERMRSVEELYRKMPDEATDGQNNDTKIGQGVEDDGRATGLLIANDVDYKRAHMLIHQMKRLNSPNVIVTNHDATLYPSIKLPSDEAPDGNWHPNKYLKFDRILADVPCSGDGTVRKNPEIWLKWTPGNAMGLYNIQCRILVRALQMLKVGGRVVYSTCSMSPVENEAVIATSIDRCGGASRVQIVDASRSLPGLKRENGFTQWPIMDKAGRTWHSWDDAQNFKEKNGEAGLDKLVKGMFAPEVSESSPALQHCMRVYPYLQDTGGFFIAILEKQSEIRAKPEAEEKQPKQNGGGITKAIEELTNPAYEGKRIDAFDTGPPVTPEHEINPSSAERLDEPAVSDDERRDSKRKRDQDDHGPPKRLKRAESPRHYPPVDHHIHRHYPPPPGAELDLTEHHHDHISPTPVASEIPQRKKRDQPFEEVFKYLDPNHPVLDQIFEFYNISPRFPRDRFMVRNATGIPTKTIYYTTSLARSILRSNEGKGMKFVHSGVKMFVKQDVQGRDTCPWRIQTDGLPIIESWVGQGRVVRLYERETLRKLLVEMFPKVTGDGWRDLGEIGERVRGLDMGCCVLRVELKADEEGGLSERMVLPLWRSLHSLNLMLPKEERRALLLRLFNDSTPLIHMKRSDADKIHQNGHENERSTRNERANSSSPDDDAERGLSIGNEKDEDAQEEKMETEARPLSTADDRVRQEDEDIVDLEAERAEEVQPFIQVDGEDDTFNHTV